MSLIVIFQSAALESAHNGCGPWKYKVGDPQFKGSRDSSIGTATRYGLGGPGIESRWKRAIPHPSRQNLEPTQSPATVQTRHEAHPVPCTMRTMYLSLG
jgi:hypothetical protein